MIKANLVAERPLELRTFRWMLLFAVVVYIGLAAYAILASHPQDPRYWDPEWVAKQYPQLEGAPKEPCYWSPDSVWYVSLAKGLLHRHHFSRQPEPPYRWDPYRTPGYPVLVALGIMITGYEWGVLLFNPLFAVLMLWSVVGLTHEIWKNAATAALAGWLAILLPPCLSWSEFLLTDYVHGCLVVVGFYLTLVAVRRSQWSYGIGAALAWSACQWIRPTSQLAAVFIVLIAIWQARRRPQFLLVAFLVVSSFLTPLYLCCRMFHDYGVFSPSLTGRLGVRHYLMTDAEAMATGQPRAVIEERSFQTDAEWVMKLQPGSAAKDRSDVRSQFALERLGAIEGFALPLYHVEGEAIRDVLRKHPGFVGLAYVKGFFFQLVWSPWGSPLRWENPLRNRVTAHLMRLAYWFFLGLAAVASWEGRRRDNGWAVVVLWLSFLFWIVTSCIIAGGGSRYRFPGDLLLIPLAAYGWMVLVSKLGGLREAPNRT